jgi:hypothetical protein
MAFGTLMITEEREMDLEAKANAELLLVDVLL